MRKHLLPLTAFFLGAALALAGCEQQPAGQQPAEQQLAEQQPAEQQPAEQQPAEQQIEITVQSPIILAEGHTQLADGKYVVVYLEMTKGEYFQAIPPACPYASNFQGTYQFRVAENDYPQNTLYAQEVSFDDGTELTFNQTFTLEMQDYNEDGNPDFTLGQRRMGNTHMLYQMYSIDPNGEIFDLSFSDGRKAFTALADTTKGESFSIKLETENGNLILSNYDMEHAEIKETTYQWENGSFHAL